MTIQAHFDFDDQGHVADEIGGQDGPRLRDVNSILFSSSQRTTLFAEGSHLL